MMTGNDDGEPMIAKEWGIMSVNDSVKGDCEDGCE
jgi:hypothetical protein